MNDVLTGIGTTGDNKPLIFCGLTKENVGRLIAGEPIRVPAERLRKLGFAHDLEIMIGYAEDQATMLAILEGAMQPGDKST